MEVKSGFTENEVKLADDFVKFIGQHFKKEMDTTEAFKYVQLFQNINSCLKKMHGLIMEPPKITEPEEKPASKPKRGK